MSDVETVIKAFKGSFKLYAEKCLMIKTKDAKIISLKFNFAQNYLDQKIIEHKRRTGGKVRMIIIKARQFGISTYVEGRFIWRTTLNKATNAFIMADSRNSSGSIFEMTKRYYDLLPENLPKPPLRKSNEKALVFDGIDSSFRIGTAGAKTTGRSMTNQLLHCSEVAFWANTDDIKTGLFQTVPDNNESEIILESTANGVGGFFHDTVYEGLEEDSEWETIFLPWFWHPEYSKEAPKDFKMTDEEYKLKVAHNLNDDQLFWRRMKVRTDFKGKEYLFQQEYPSTIDDAFLSTQNGLIKGKILKESKFGIHNGEGSPKIMGVDPARNGDRTVIVIRQGRVILKVIKYDEMESQQLAGILKNIMDREQIDACFIDTGCGYGTIDRLKEHGYRQAKGIPFNSGATKKDLYTNKRSEMFGDMREWFNQDGGVKIPDDEILVKELSIMPQMTVNGNGQEWMMLKEDIKKKNNGASTDYADGVALTFAEPVRAITVMKTKRFAGLRN